jgi:hypothetical protein
LMIFQNGTTKKIVAAISHCMIPSSLIYAPGCLNFHGHRIWNRGAYRITMPLMEKNTVITLFRDNWSLTYRRELIFLCISQL